MRPVAMQHDRRAEVSPVKDAECSTAQMGKAWQSYARKLGGEIARKHEDGAIVSRPWNRASF